MQDTKRGRSDKPIQLILVADDEVLIRIRLRDFLRDCGSPYKVIEGPEHRRLRERTLIEKVTDVRSAS